MLKAYREIDMDYFEAWSGGADTLDRIRDAGKTRELESLLEEMEPEEGWTETAINDILWFDDEWLYKSLGIDPYDKEEEEEEEETPTPDPLAAYLIGEIEKSMEEK